MIKTAYLSDILRLEIDKQWSRSDSSEERCLIRFLLALIQETPFEMEDRRLLNSGRFYEKLSFSEQFVHALNILFVLDPLIEKRVFQSEYIIPEVNDFIFSRSTRLIAAHRYDFNNGATGLMFYLKSCGTEQVEEMKLNFVNGIRAYLEGKAYQVHSAPQNQLSHIADTLFGLYFNNEHYDQQREENLIQVIDLCFDALFSFWEDVNIEEYKYLFFGKHPENATLTDLLNWKEGDLQKSNIILAYSIFKNNKTLYRTGLLVGLHTLILPSLLKDDIDSYDFQHGALGLLYGYNALYDFTGDVKFLEASKAWQSKLEVNLYNAISLEGKFDIKAKIDLLTCYAFLLHKSSGS
ncbi:hypothetical protein SAMN05421820_101203 [Pedobacter steynii]|uniref:Lanthionine synthetase C-like protein n=1 Tax=Pedobacter steynii TaxID=430522 RepID=A0A1G9JAD7_9SPHI|nr:hypothetical protein [Pedobacter steynii]NQX38194.1 hypothetical protein [Pedobacter steynii]SDL34510.1 hypothetical protein SAMN05421820_101203 [Pedobacter steynii]